MRIAPASDHAGFPLREEIADLLWDHELTDFGTYDASSCDLPDFAYIAEKHVRRLA
jgi:ribose 5-phosphate isomerase B